MSPSVSSATMASASSPMSGRRSPTGFVATDSDAALRSEQNAVDAVHRVRDRTGCKRATGVSVYQFT
jgi:hypothetical protein